MDDLAEYKWSIWLKIKTPALRDAGATQKERRTAYIL